MKIFILCNVLIIDFPKTFSVAGSTQRLSIICETVCLRKSLVSRCILTKILLQELNVTLVVYSETRNTIMFNSRQHGSEGLGTRESFPATAFSVEFEERERESCLVSLLAISVSISFTASFFLFLNSSWKVSEYSPDTKLFTFAFFYHQCLAVMFVCGRSSGLFFDACYNVQCQNLDSRYTASRSGTVNLYYIILCNSHYSFLYHHNSYIPCLLFYET